MAEINQTHPGNPVNEPTTKEVRTRSTFKNGYPLFDTPRFGDLTPFFVMETVADDKFMMQSRHNIRSYTMEAPKLQTLSKKKDYFFVPKESILPLNWEKVLTNPLIGDDVQMNVGCVVDQAVSKICVCYTTLKNHVLDLIDEALELADDEGPEAVTTNMHLMILNWAFRYYITAEMFFSAGSLLPKLGYKLINLVNESDPKTIAVMDNNFDEFIEHVKGFYIGEDTNSMIKYELNDQDYIHFPKHRSVSLRRILELMRENIEGEITEYYGSDSTTMISSLETLRGIITKTSAQLLPTTRPLNFYRVAAYQLVCAHFYSVDTVDYVYSADLYRQVMQSYTEGFGSLTGVSTEFSLNGINHRYDTLSGFYIEKALEIPGGNYWSDAGTIAQLQYLQGLFAIRKSLRFVDYFTGAKTRPLAIGDTAVNVDNNKVSVVDVTKSIQMQRYLNSVNRAGRKFSEYIKGIFGVTPAYDYHNPGYLGHTADTVAGIETENTGEGQLQLNNSITSNFRGNANTFAFEFESDRPEIVIGIGYYDFQRVYKTVTERNIFHRNRFDEFIPTMQYIGDQEVYGEETNMKNKSTFGYQLRNMEYKQRVPQAAGGFIDNLPAWIYDADENGRNGKGEYVVVNEEYIRSSNVELDKYFISLTGYSLGNYFHFIEENDNEVTANRPMTFAPSIL